MDLYISKKCQHCGQLLVLLKENPNLQPYFIIKAIEEYPYPKELKVVPSLIKDNQIYSGKELNSIINDVNRFDMERNGHISKTQQVPEQRQPPVRQNIPTNVLDEREMQLQKYKEPHKQPQQPQMNNNDGDIMGVCDSEGCMFESIDNNNTNNLMDGYCFIDEGYKENNLNNNNNNNNSSDISKSNKFNNNAYEELVKNRR